MYIGTSLGQCLVSLLKKQVPREKVALIITRTRSTTRENFLLVVKQYYVESDSRFTGYDFRGFNWDEVEELALSLYDQGKIHQPRNFNPNQMSNFLIDEMSYGIWMEVVPVYNGNNHAVLDAYSKYKMLRNLTE